MIKTQYRQIRNPFEQPILQERQDKSVGMTDAQEIFRNVSQNKNTLNFKDASKLLNDLSYVIIPFDKTNKHF